MCYLCPRTEDLSPKWIPMHNMNLLYEHIYIRFLWINFTAARTLTITSMSHPFLVHSVHMVLFIGIKQADNP